MAAIPGGSALPNNGITSDNTHKNAGYSEVGDMNKDWAQYWIKLFDRKTDELMEVVGTYLDKRLPGTRKDSAA